MEFNILENIKTFIRIFGFYLIAFLMIFKAFNDLQSEVENETKTSN